MSLPLRILIGAIAVLHAWFLVFEMFLWRTPLARNTFGMTQEVADSSAVLAANQGVYNGFLAAGLVWGLFFVGEAKQARQVLAFFLGCVIVAGAYGGFSAKLWILLTQSLPAAIALVLLLRVRPRMS